MRWGTDKREQRALTKPNGVGGGIDRSESASEWVGDAKIGKENT